MKHQAMKNLALSAMLLAVGLVLPFVTGQIPQIGNMLLPMHIPVLLTGLICGWKYGLIVGFVTPLLRSVLFGMPIFYPNALAMAFELMTYGGVIGFLYEKSKWKCIVALYRCLLLSMLSGRVVWGIVQMILLGGFKGGFTFSVFMAGAFLNAIPGIILQLILIPSFMLALHKTGLVTFRKHKKEMRHTCQRNK